MGALYILSIVIEAIVAILGVLIAVKKKKNYGWFIAITFGIYVLYDGARSVSIRIGLDLLYFIFFIASVSMLIAAWEIYKKAK